MKVPVLDDLEAEYAALREELDRLQQERARLDAKPAPNLQEERAYAARAGALHERVARYLTRLERLRADDSGSEQ